ncbi:DUF1254 domain-containing protein [Variovorax dokdonensis]|uniref:DUF1254 domain-containing protein n=2 Tax=Variovorax dokdonensis TaxID=344883 RepID=UPI0036F32311
MGHFDSDVGAGFEKAAARQIDSVAPGQPIHQFLEIEGNMLKLSHILLRGFMAACVTGLQAVAAPASAAAPPQPMQVAPAEMRAIAKDATIYGFPLVDNYRVMHSYFVDSANPEFKAPWNTIHSVGRVFTPEDKAIQTPNSDTPYSQLGADLRSEPLVITVPAVEKDRYYSLQFIDLYTFNFAYVGSRSTGTQAGSYLLAGPGWKGKAPAGIRQVIRSETELAFVLVRTQLKSPQDIGNVKTIQAGYKVQPLSTFLGESAPGAAPAIDYFEPLSAKEQRSSIRFFDELNFLLQFAPTHPSETALRARFARIGIVPGQPFNADRLTPQQRQAVEEGMADAWQALDRFKTEQIDTGKRTSSDGFGTRKFLKNDYLVRMASAAFGIYGNSKEEAMYPAYFVDSKGQALDASRERYVLRFAPGKLPPVNAFWSVTMYGLPESLLVANPLNRYLINSAMLPDLKRDADGGITLYLQNESPGKDLESNWLPAPKGPFWAAMRLYWPKQEALDGRWKQPPLQRVGARVAESAAKASTAAQRVTVENFARAESDLYFAGIVKNGGFGKFDHTRNVAPLDKQTVVRLNRDTLYSAGVFDLDAGPVTITLPDPGSRFMSMQVMDEDQYTHGVHYKPGSYTFDRASMGTRYFVAAIRLLVDPNDAQDLAKVRALQDSVKVQQQATGSFEIPRWDAASQKKVRDALVVLADTLPDKNRMFGSKAEVDPVRYLMGAASAWGGNPDKDAVYLSVVPAGNDGKTIYKLTAREVPVDGFWSVSVYDARGYYQKNSFDAYTMNNITAKKEADGSVNIQFGGCEAKTVNCLPITRGWNYMVRLYRPRAEILDGRWKFPEAQAAR